MDKQIDRVVMRQNPELMGDYHLPIFARVESISDPIYSPAVGEQFRPRYAVDLCVLDESDQPDAMFPLLRAVPLPVACAGLERGMYGFPQPGAIVELAFAYGLPSKPFIRTILTDGLSLPAVEPGELVMQAGPGVSQRADVDGNWRRETYGDITDKSLHHKVDTFLNEIVAQLQHIYVAQHCTEQVGGIKHLEALGALKLLSGGVTHLSALDDLKLLSGKDVKVKATHDLVERVGNIADSFAKVKQIIKVQNGGKIWLGSEAENVLKILSELIQVVADIANTAKDHIHEYTDNGNPLKTKKPDQSGDFGGEKSAADGLKGRLDPIISAV